MTWAERPLATPPLIAGAQAWQIEDVLQLSQGCVPLALSDVPAWRERIEGGAAYLARLLEEHGEIYGVTTGYGASCHVTIPPHLVNALPLQLTRFHGCGLGQHLDHTASRAVLAVRLCSLAKGYSGVRLALLQGLVDLLNHDITPLIPEEGSVGASGDLTPLSYVAAALIGEREVRYQGRQMPASEALSAAGLTPLTLHPKEGLALMNGTAVMTALACLAYQRAAYLVRMSSRITAVAAALLQSNPRHFHPRLFAAKPFVGQAQVAAWIHQALPQTPPTPLPRLQERYSIRCAPHVIGVLADALPWMREHIEIELNSANDNPLLDLETPEAAQDPQLAILHGGHFYGGHIAFAMDSMKNAVANIADLLDRQLALLVDPQTNAGLPANLSGATGPHAAISHGLKALQIGASAWAAEALKLTMPASVFSRSTESHNQDKVSMGTIAARDALRVLTLTEQVTAAMLVAITQGVGLRERDQECPDFPPAIKHFLDALQDICPLLVEDRPLEATLRQLVDGLQRQAWPLQELS